MGVGETAFWTPDQPSPCAHPAVTLGQPLWQFVAPCDMIWLLPHPPTLPSASCLSFSVFLCVARRAYRREGLGKGGREEAKAWYSTYNHNYSYSLAVNILCMWQMRICVFRTRFGTKQVLGRTSVGPYAYCSGPGHFHTITFAQIINPIEF